MKNILSYDEFALCEMNSFHGAGKGFDKFCHDYIGTGEGAQIYGWGSYFTDSIDLAEFYIRNAILNTYQRDSDEYMKLKNIFKKRDEFNHRKEDKFGIMHGYLYSVTIPDNNGKNYLNWNETDRNVLIEVFNKIKDKLTDEQREKARRRVFHNDDKITDGVFKWLKGKFNNFNTYQKFGWMYVHIAEMLGSQKAMSELLNSVGYTGIIVPMGNRQLKKGNVPAGYNYVVFNDKDIKIEKREHIKYDAEKMNRFSGKYENNPIIKEIETDYLETRTEE